MTVTNATRKAKAQTLVSNINTNFSTLNTKIGTKVDKVQGKGLSANDFTDALKTKLEGLENYTLPNATDAVLGGVMAGSNVTIVNGVISADVSTSQVNAKQDAITAQAMLDADLVDDTNADHKFVSTAEKTAWSGKQSAITSSAMLDADLVDDSTADHKFVSTSEKTTWSAKQNAITSSAMLDADLVDDATSTNKFVTSTEKSTWSAKQNAITAQAMLDADLVDDSEATNKFVTATEKSTWSGKQDALSSAQLQAIADVADKVDKVEGKGLSANDYTDAEKTKLGALPDNATLQSAINAKTTMSAVEALGYQTASQVQALISASQHLKKSVVAQLPAVADAEENVIYLVPVSGAGETNNVKNEYILIDGSFELLGTTQVDLSGYYTSAEVDDYLDELFDTTVTLISE